MANNLAVHPALYLARIKRDDIKGTFKALWNHPYPADPLLEPEFEGLTYGQVAVHQQMIAAARGSLEALNTILDRIIGKPEQVNKNLNVQGTYADFMEQVAIKEGIIDVDASAANSDQQPV